MGSGKKWEGHLFEGLILLNPHGPVLGYGARVNEVEGRLGQRGHNPVLGVLEQKTGKLGALRQNRLEVLAFEGIRQELPERALGIECTGGSELGPTRNLDDSRGVSKRIDQGALEECLGYA